MPNVYFNTEIGQAESVKIGVQALLLAAEVYKVLNHHCEQNYRDCPDASMVCIVRDEHGFPHSLKDCVRSMPKQSLDKVMPLVYGLNRSVVIEAEEFDDLEGWIVEQFGVHSPLLEYAAKRRGMLLTVAVTDDWKHNFFTFHPHSSERVPNLWGQQDVSPIEAWLDAWYQEHNAPHEELLRRCDDLVLCRRALPEDDFTQQEWVNIVEHFERARARKYEVDNSLIKDLLPNVTKHGPLYELRLYSGGIRILFALRKNDNVRYFSHIEKMT